MAHLPPFTRRSLAALTAAVTVAGLSGASPAPAAPTPGRAAVAPSHSTVVADIPGSNTPDITDGTVFAIHDAGTKVVAAGSFTKVENRNSDVSIPRNYVLAFNKATGTVDTAFAPVVDGEVRAVIAGPTAGTVYLAGDFNTVNGVTRRKLVLLNMADGSLAAGFQGPAFNGLVMDIALAGNRLLVGGIFTTAGNSNPRGGLASLNATTGAVDSYLTTNLTEHHNWNGVSGAQAGVGVEKLALAPDGQQLVVIGNFKKADGVLHDQIVKLTLGDAAATITNWNTTRYTPRCAYNAFDSYVRDVTFAPDSSYFVVVTTGAGFVDTLCDAAARWDATATGADLQPTWVNYSGGDTFLSVGISERAVYVGGHLRWVNNSLGRDKAQPGAVGRASIAALDPVNGLPLSWNPGRHPRGYGVAEMLVTPQGIWLGSDQAWIGNFQHRRERIAFFPLAGGKAPHSTSTAVLPGKVYQVGGMQSSKYPVKMGRVAIKPTDGRPLPDSIRRPGTPIEPHRVTVRSYDGVSTVGAPTTLVNPDATLWANTRGAFWVGGTLFYGMGSTLNRRTFNGTTFGPATAVDPYHDAYWDAVPTDSAPVGQTYVGMTGNFYPEIPNVTGMFYTAGRLYYTLTGQTGLHWRWFNPDSGTVGADKFTVAGATGFNDISGIFVAGTTLYTVSRSTGNLATTGWANLAPSGTPTIRSGPTVDGVDWRARALFVGP